MGRERNRYSQMVSYRNQPRTPNQRGLSVDKGGGLALHLGLRMDMCLSETPIFEAVAWAISGT